MRSVILLAHLNDIDLTVDGLRARLAEIAAALREPAALAAALRAAADAEAELARCRVRQADLELVQKNAADKLARARQRLYDGKVRSPRELESAEADELQLSHQLGAAEDRLLEALIATEAAAETEAACRAEHARLTTEWKATQASLRSEAAQAKTRLAAEQARLAAVRRDLPAPLLATYDSLRARRGGRVVAKLDGDECSVCRVAASPSRLAEARFGDEVVFCANCGRILWGE